MLNQEEIDAIVQFVKQEPCTVQDIAKLIKRSWVTADAYLQQIKNNTGLIDIKTFRKGSQGALKIVFFNHADTLTSNDLKARLLEQIKNARTRSDFDFFEIFQFVNDEQKKFFTEEYDDENVSKTQKVIPFLKQAERVVYIFSGNLSLINIREEGVLIRDVLEELAKRRVKIKILCRVNIASLNNIAKLAPVLDKYPDYIEIKHTFQPLRGYIIDDTVARFKNEEVLKNYKRGELNKNTKIFYEMYDKEWIAWLQKVFWDFWRTSIEYRSRAAQLKKLL